MPDPFPPAATQPTAQYLRLAELSFGRFQSFCRDLVKALPGVVECQQYGVQGDPQGGIDLVATMASAETECYQCRRVKSFTPGALQKLVTTVTYPARHYFVLIACEATAGVRDEAAERPNWTVWDIDDISAKVRALPVEVARRIVRTNFGGQACRDFLGIQPFATFLLPDEFFTPLLDAGKLFNHAWQLVGRESELARLSDFISSNELIYVLSGRGGIGKSKLLRAFATKAEETHAVFFAQQDVGITPEALSELPVADTIIVVDDAHRRQDLGLLFAHAVRTRTKLVLATRPQLSADIPSRAAQHQIEMSDIVRPEPLDALSFEEVLALAKEVLGPEMEGAAEALATATQDCPLITIVGGALLREKHVHPALLSNDEAFRETALARFFDEIVEHAAPGTSDAALRQLLAVIAALAPVHPASQRFADVVTTMTGFDLATARSWCERLEAHGVLSLQEGGYRIVPDVLSDYVLGTACARTDAFVERLVTASGSFDPALLRNLAAVDWRVGKKTGAELSVLGSVWESVVAAFVAAPNSERSQMLRDMREVGYFLPNQMLDLAVLALERPSGAAETGPFAAYVRTTHEDVIAHLPEVVRFATYTAETFDRACDLLWRLALDPRLSAPPAMLGEKNAAGVLADIMAFSLKKPLWVQERLLSRAETWLRIARTERERIALTLVVAPLFSRTGTDHTARDLQITMRSFTVSGDGVAALRSRATQIITTILQATERRVVGAAVKALKHAIEPPHSLGGLMISDEFRAECEPDRLAALDMLRALVTRNHDPVIAAQVTDIVEWYATNDANSDVRAASEAVLGSIVDDAHLRITMAIHDPWGHRFRPRDDAAAKAVVDAAANDLARDFQPDEAIREIGDIIDGLRDLDLHVTPHILLGAIMRKHPDAAARMFEAAVADDASTFAAHAGALLGPLHSVDAARFHALVEAAVGAGARRVCASIASVYYWWLKEEGQDERDIEMIRRLFGMGGEVARAAMALFPELAKTEPRIASELAVDVDLGADASAAATFSRLFEEAGGALLSAVTDAELRTCVLKLAATPQLSDWQVGAFLQAASARTPLSVIELFIARVARERDDDGVRYSAIPIDAAPLALDAAATADPAYRELLSSIATLYDNGATYEAPRVFVLAAGDMNETAVDVLKALSASQTDAASTFVANCLRGDGCRRVILGDAAFVEQLLDDAVAVSHELFDVVRDAVVSCAVPATTTAEQRASIATAAAAHRDQLPFTSRARDVYERAVARLDRISQAMPPSAGSGLVIDDE